MHILQSPEPMRLVNGQDLPDNPPCCTIVMCPLRHWPHLTPGTALSSQGERERETGGQESWEEAVGSGLSGAEHTHCYNDGNIKAKCLLTFKSLKCQQS